MTADTKKISQLITEVRKQRGMTQADFAERLGTSQSAVNRIENGKQNLSMEMLGRISDVLNRELLKINQTGTINFKIEGGRPLSGEVITKTSKNAAVVLLAASLLNHGTTRLKRMPRIEEVNRLIEVLTSIGVQIRWLEDNELEIKPPAKLQLDSMDEEAARKTRSVLLFLAPLMHLFGSFTLPYAGGCNLGKRTIQPHLFALEEFGMSVNATRGRYHVSVRRKNPEEVVLYEMGDTVTENAIMAAARLDGWTEIHMASANYMVQELCFFLSELGVKFEGIGTTKLRIKGRNNINKSVTYYPSEDPIESMLFISIAATTNSALTIKRCPIDFLELELLKLKKMGVRFEQSARYKADNQQTDLVDIKMLKTDELVALDEKIHPQPYPGLNIDNLPFFVPVAARAKGKTLIHDWVYENRAIYFTELTKLGVEMELLDPHRIHVFGPTKWRRADIVCPPALRPAVIVLIGMLAADGVSTLRNIYSITRGYEDLAERLNALGAKIEILRDI
jgi:UDP-N-acetylglucosamine 1-carboxyvinyltransferase